MAGHFKEGGDNMKRNVVIVTVLLCVLVFAGLGHAAPAGPYGRQMIMYDGYLYKTAAPVNTNVLADTLIVVNNSHGSIWCPVWIQVFDKYGTEVASSTLFNGGISLGNNTPPNENAISPNGFGWITLGMLVARTTHDPWDWEPAAEKFTYKITAGLKQKPVVVEIKQVIYNSIQPYAGEAIWQPANIKTWAETSLGGLRGGGFVSIGNVLW
jgi:hypothetical protein